MRDTRLTLLLVLAAAVPALAAPLSVRLSGGAKAEDKLRRFVEQDARLKARLEDAARREEAFTVWFDRPFVLAALYGREREAVLHAVR